MQKKLIALAVAGIAAAPAFAQSNVTIYGRADAGYVNRGGSDGDLRINGTKNEIASGIGGGSRFGLRGTEDLGGGLKAIFQMEYNVQLEQAGINTSVNGGANLASRNSWVGLTGNFGTALVGRVDGARYGVATKYDPFGSGYVGNMASIQSHVSRGDNAVAYVSPSFSGFKVLAAYTTSLIGQESQAGAKVTDPTAAAPAAKANAGDVRLWAIQPSYENGPLSITLNFEGFSAKDSPRSSDGTIAVAAGTYDFGMVKVHAYYEQVKSDECGASPNPGNNWANRVGAACAAGVISTDQWDQRSWMLGVTVPFGMHSIRASYVDLNDKTATDAAGRQATGDCRKYSIGYSYSLSKRTSLYADYAKINNDDHGTCAITFSGSTGALDASAAGASSSGGAGYGTHGFDLGIAHTF